MMTVFHFTCFIFFNYILEFEAEKYVGFKFYSGVYKLDSKQLSLSKQVSSLNLACPKVSSSETPNSVSKCFQREKMFKVYNLIENSVLRLTLSNNVAYSIESQYVSNDHVCNNLMDIKNICPDSRYISVFNNFYKNDNNCVPTYDRLCKRVFSRGSSFLINTIHEPMEITIECFNDDNFVYSTSFTLDAYCDSFSCLSNGKLANELTNKCDKDTESQDYYIIYVNMDAPFELFCSSALIFLHYMEKSSESLPIIGSSVNNWYTIDVKASSRFVCNKAISFNHEYWVIRESDIKEGSSKSKDLYGCQYQSNRCRTNLFKTQRF